MHRHPRFWLGSVAFGLATLVLATPTQADTPSKYLPNDTEFIVTLNVQQLLDAPLVQKEWLSQVKEGLKKGETPQILKALGFNPLKDLTNITIAGALSKEPEKKLAIITGNFDVDKFQKLAKEHAKNSGDHLKITKEGKYKVWEVAGHNVPNFPETVYITMVDNTTVLVAGGKDYLKEALNKADGKKTTELKKEIAAALAKADPKQSATLMVESSAIANADFIPNEQQQQVAKGLEQLKTITLGVTLAKDLAFKANIVAKSAAAARKMSQDMNKYLLVAPTLIGVVASNNEQLAPYVDLIKEVINGTKVSAKGDSVIIKMAINQELMQKMQKAAQKKADD